MVAAFKDGLARMQQIGGAEMNDRTMIDALKPTLDALCPHGIRKPPPDHRPQAMPPFDRVCRGRDKGGGYSRKHPSG
jgi:hypothetical protein